MTISKHWAGKYWAAAGACSLTLTSLTSSPHAQETPPAAPPTVEDAAAAPIADNRTVAAEEAAASGRKDGWDPGLLVGVGFNLIDTQNVVGQQTGTSVTLSGGIDAVAPFNSGIHEWRNNLLASAGVTRTPSLDEFVKTNDGLAFETLYLVHLLEELGPFARFAFNTQMFPSLDIQPAPVDYLVTNLDGSVDAFTGRRLALTEAFQPLTLKQSLGAFWQPLRSERVSFETRAGLGAQETLAKGAFVIDDDDATPQVDVREIDDSWLMGAEAVINSWGFIDAAQNVSYSVGVGVLVPFAAADLPPGDDRSVVELTTLEALAAINVKLFDWASLGYKLSVLRQPLVVDKVQVSNSLLLTIGGAFGSKAPAPPPPEEPPPCDCKAEAETAPEPAPPAESAPEAAPPSTPEPTPADAPASEVAPAPPAEPAPPADAGGTPDAPAQPEPEPAP